MDELTSDEVRVLGVLIEKAMTTPEQYPLSLNAIVSGASQKNNRDPVMEMDEDRAFAAVSSLRDKGLAIQFSQPGMRVHKFKHAADVKLGLNPRQLVIMAELLLRGAQTLGELRGRASRMYNIESLDVAKSVVGELAGRPEPLVRELPPAPGSRAERYEQLLGGETVGDAVVPAAGQSGEADAPAAAGAAATGSGPAAAGNLAHRVEALEAEVAQLRAALRKLATAMGEPDPLPSESASGRP
jgi:uncharacterized protein YceH (UPF0502 family)